jgi:hypothetical protein
MTMRKKTLKPLHPEEYDGSTCPRCGNKDDVVAYDSLFETDTAEQSASCDECGAAWTELYRLDGYTDLMDSAGKTLAIPRTSSYTVLLLYPDYMATEYGHETFLTHVRANTGTEAVRQARKEACIMNDHASAKDFFVLAVFHGHHEDIWTP